MGLRNIDRVVPMLIPATTTLGRPYYQLGEVYQALLTKRQKELSSVAKIVGGVEEVRYHAGRGTIPFKPVAAERQRKAVKFLLARGFIRPNALLDEQVLWRLSPYDAAAALQDVNEALLKRLVDPDVFHRMAEAATLSGATGSLSGRRSAGGPERRAVSEIKQPRPTIDLYRRDLQRTYVSLLLSSYSNAGPSEFKVALRAGIGDLAGKLEQGAKKVRDPDTRAHLKDLAAAMGN